jgi:hypothetical protein
MPPCTYQQAPELLEDTAPCSAMPPEGNKVIEFPGPSAPPTLFSGRWGGSFEPVRVVDDLAEPILDQPRILEAPETAPEAPPMLPAQLELDPPAEDEDAVQVFKPDFEVPLQVAPWPQRCIAAAVDLLTVLLATAVFIGVVAKTAPGIPHGRATLAVILAVPFLFWAVYHYIFLVHAGLTPGMHCARLGLSTFDDAFAPRRLRRWRALVMVLSCASLGLGFLWALFDDDNLCWHDRMTRTYLRELA